MNHTTHETYARSSRERVAGMSRAIQTRREEREARESTRAAPFYDEVDARLMDTFPASDAVARY